MKKYSAGEKIYFAEEKKPYVIRACDKRFLICTKPYNFKPETVIYTIVDLKEGIRGTDNYCLSIYDYYYTEDCEDALKALKKYAKQGTVSFEENTMYISSRNRLKLNIVEK